MVIVGAGPIGVELAVALKREGIEYVQFDARQVGHTISWWAPQTRFFSSSERIAIAGVPLNTADGGKVSREEYLLYLRSVVQQFGLKVRTFHAVSSIVPESGGGFLVTTESRAGVEVCRARKVVLATGGTERPRLINVPGEDLPHVSHYFKDPHLYFGQRLLVVGGKNSAAEAALRCFHAGAKVTMSYRQGALSKSIKYWILPELQSLIDGGRIGFMPGSVVTGITASRVEFLLGTGGTGEAVSEAFDFVLLMTGYVADMTLFEVAGVRLAAGTRAPEFDVETMETNVAGLFVAGTAVAGTQERYEVFLENAHIHVDRIVCRLKGERYTGALPVFARPET